MSRITMSTLNQREASAVAPEAAGRSRIWATKGMGAAVFLAMIAAALQTHASQSPRVGEPIYLYRIVAVGAVFLLPMMIRDPHLRRGLGLPLLVFALVFMTWGPVTLKWTPDVNAGAIELGPGILAVLGALVIICATAGDARRL